MGKVDALVGCRVYLDTNVFIYALEGIPKWRDLSRSILRLVDERRSEAVTSELALCECLVKPFQSGRQEFAETYLRFLQPRPGLAVVPVARSVLVQAARLRADGLTLPDAIHAATALQQTCTHFLTNDDRFQILSGIRVLMLKELVSS